MSVITREDYLERIKKFCLMDDTFMNKFFEGNIPGTEFLLRTILNDDKIKVVKVKTQYYLNNLRGRSMYLDVLAQDQQGKYFNVEVQRKDEGAIPQRARYHASLVDANTLIKNTHFDELRPTYIIFITEHDVLGGNLPIYHISRTIKELNTDFNDDSHIIYVNGARRTDNTALGRLLHDFFCKNPSDMYNEQYAQRAKYFKESKGGIDEMCELMQELTDRAAAAARLEGIQEGKLEGIREGKLEGIREGKLEGIREGERTGERNTKLSLLKNLIKDEGFSKEKAFKLLGIAPEEWDYYLPKLN